MPKHGIKTAARDAIRTDARQRKALAKAQKDALAQDGKRRNEMPTHDSFVNFAQNMGIGANNPLSSASYGFNPITRIRTVLEWIHRGSWLGATAIDLKADDMTRAGVEITGSMLPKDMAAVETETQRLDVWKGLNQTIKWAKLYGGAVAYMMVEGQDPRTPLRADAIGRGQFKGVLALDRWMIEPSLNDLVTELGPNLGKPKYYTINPMAPALPRITFHYTRCIRLLGFELPYWQAMMENLWGISVLERIYDRMVAYDSATTGAAQLMYKMHLRTYKVKGLRELIGAGGRAYQGLLQQINVMRQFQNQEAITLMDMEDELETQTSSAIAGIADALDQFGQQFSGAVGIPQMRLFGQSPKGFNPGDNDIRMYYDSILQEQNRDLLQGTTIAYKATALSLGHRIGDDFGVKFRPLWQLSEKEKAEVGETVGRTVQAAVDGALISPKTGAKELKQSSIETGIFTNISNEDIEALDEEVAPKAEEAMGGEGEIPSDEQIGSEDGKAQDADTRSDLEKFARQILGPGRYKGITRISSTRYALGNGWMTTESDRLESLLGASASVTNSNGYVNVSLVSDSLSSVLAMKRIHDLDVVVENVKGSIREGVGDDKIRFRSQMPDDYGYLRRTVGDDMQPIDCFIGLTHDSAMAWVIQTLNPLTKAPDEQKVMLGYKSAAAALQTFISSYASGGGWTRFGGMVPASIDVLKDWLKGKRGTFT